MNTFAWECGDKTYRIEQAYGGWVGYTTDGEQLATADDYDGLCRILAAMKPAATECR